MIRSLNWKYGALLAAALVLILNFWCQLHGAVLGGSPVAFDTSMPWALKSALGWVLAGSLLALLGARVAMRQSKPAWPMAALLPVAVVTLTIGSEVLVIRGDTPVLLWIYNRLPTHALFAVLLVAAWLLLRARQEGRAAPAASRDETSEDGVSPPHSLVEVMTGTGRTQVRIADIECLEADRNYINVHTPQRSYLLRQTLSSLEKSLDARDFRRVHRSIIVNRTMIRERRSGGVLVLSSGRQVRVSRAFAQQVNDLG
jgi:DNA-binding LytR/AlgR family response regulator